MSPLSATLSRSDDSGAQAESNTNRHLITSLLMTVCFCSGCSTEKKELIPDSPCLLLYSCCCYPLILKILHRPS